MLSFSLKEKDVEYKDWSWKLKDFCVAPKQRRHPMKDEKMGALSRKCIRITD
jgi:hypothetical protein